MNIDYMEYLQSYLGTLNGIQFDLCDPDRCTGKERRALFQLGVLSENMRCLIIDLQEEAESKRIDQKVE